MVRGEVGKNPIPRVYKNLGLQMYRDGFDQVQVSAAIRQLDQLCYRYWDSKIRSRNAKQEARKIWLIYGRQEVRKIKVECAATVERLKHGKRYETAYPEHGKIKRSEQAKLWIEDFLSRDENKMGRQVTHVVSFGYMERGFGKSQMFYAMEDLTAEGKFTRTLIPGKRGGAKLAKLTIFDEEAQEKL